MKALIAFSLVVLMSFGVLRADVPPDWPASVSVTLRGFDGYEGPYALSWDDAQGLYQWGGGVAESVVRVVPDYYELPASPTGAYLQAEFFDGGAYVTGIEETHVNYLGGGAFSSSGEGYEVSGPSGPGGGMANPISWSAPTNLTAGNVQAFLTQTVAPYYGPLLGLGLLIVLVWAIYRVVRGGVESRDVADHWTRGDAVGRSVRRHGKRHGGLVEYGSMRRRHRSTGERGRGIPF